MNTHPTLTQELDALDQPSVQDIGAITPVAPALTPVGATAAVMGLAMLACMAAGIAPTPESAAFVAVAGLLTALVYTLFPLLD